MSYNAEEHGHDFKRNCKPDCQCYECRSELAACVKCRGCEGGLPTDCPGEPMSGELQHDVYHGRTDYRNGRWLTGDDVGYGNAVMARRQRQEKQV